MARWAGDQGGALKCYTPQNRIHLFVYQSEGGETPQIKA